MDETMHPDIVRRASVMADKAPFVADDFAQALYPRTEVIFNDRMRSGARQYLRNVVGQIEQQICQIAVSDLGISHELLMKAGAGATGRSHGLLQDSGLFKTREIVQHLFVKTQQSELAARLLQKISQEDLEATLTRHLDHADPAVAEAAMGLLVAQSKATATPGEMPASFADLPAEIAYALAWPVTAALAKLSGLPGGRLYHATERLLASHDESAGVARKADRLAQLLEKSGAADGGAPHPMRDGLHLFIARLARQAGLTSDQITAFTAEPGMVRLVVTMRAVDYSTDSALSVFAALDSGEHILTAATYGETDRDRSLALVSKWSAPAAFQNAERILADDGLSSREK